MHPHLFPIPICSIPLPSLSNGSANPRCYIFYEECQVGLPMNMIWSNSLNFSKLHSLLAIHLLLPPYRSCLACILLIHIHKKKKKIFYFGWHRDSREFSYQRGTSWLHLLPYCSSSDLPVYFFDHSQELCTLCPMSSCCQTCRRLAFKCSLWRADC